MIAHFMALHFYTQIAVIAGTAYVLGKAMAIPVIIVEVLADLARAKMPKSNGIGKIHK